MTFCKYCGNPMGTGSRYCMICGKDGLVDRESKSDIGNKHYRRRKTQNEEQLDRKAPTERRRKRGEDINRIILLIIAFVVFVPSLGIFFALLVLGTAPITALAFTGGGGLIIFLILSLAFFYSWGNRSTREAVSIIIAFLFIFLILGAIVALRFWMD